MLLEESTTNVMSAAALQDSVSGIKKHRRNDVKKLSHKTDRQTDEQLNAQTNGLINYYIFITFQQQIIIF